jgi:hypothetical protein
MSAAVIAQLELLKFAAQLFDWALDTSRAEALVANAADKNQNAALRLP